MKEILKNCDLNFDGQIQFTEFMIAACNKRALLTQHNVDECFQYLDHDGDGNITVQDLKKILGEDIDERFIKQMLEDADEEDLQKMGKREFSGLM